MSGAHPLDSMTGDDAMRAELRRAMLEHQRAKADYLEWFQEQEPSEEGGLDLEALEDQLRTEEEVYYEELEDARGEVARRYGRFEVPAEEPSPFQAKAGPGVGSRERLARLRAATRAFRRLMNPQKG